MRGPARRSSCLPPLCVQPALQDLRRGRLIDDRPLAPTANAAFGKPTCRHHGRHPFVGQDDRHGRDDRCQPIRPRTGIDGRGPLGSGEAHGEPDNDLDRLVFLDEAGQVGYVGRHGTSVRGQVARHSHERGGQDSVGVTHRDPDAHLTQVDAQSSPPRRDRHGPLPPARSPQPDSSTAFSTAASRCGAWSAGTPPPCARSALPPPRPERAPLTRSAADRARLFAAAFTDTTSDALPRAGAATATTAGRAASILPRISCARVRTSLPAAPSGASVPTYATPCRSFAWAASDAAPPRTIWARSFSSSFSASRSAVTVCSTRSATWSPGTRNSSASRDTSRCSLARKPKASMPTSASTRRPPEPTEASERIFTRPSWPERATWVPPHSSRA